jgi:hypothetical protein
LQGLPNATKAHQADGVNCRERRHLAPRGCRSLQTHGCSAAFCALSQGKRYRYRGRHKLEPLLRFLSRALVRGRATAVSRLHVGPCGQGAV